MQPLYHFLYPIAPLHFLKYFFSFPNLVANGNRQQRGDHYILTKELLSDYGPTTPRPVRNSSHQIEVTIDLQVLQIISLVRFQFSMLLLRCHNWVHFAHRL